MLTDRQRAIYDFIVTFRRENGCSPSIPELQRAFGIRSPNGVAGHLRALIAKGFVQRAERGSRQIDPVVQEAPDQPVARIPILASIPAGYPDGFAQERLEGCVAADEALLGFAPRRGCYALKVRGESMREAGILSGDIVVVEPETTPAPGQIVVALIDGESTLKRLVRMGGEYYLKAENPEFGDLRPRTGLEIQGVVRTVIRRLQ